MSFGESLVRHFVYQIFFLHTFTLFHFLASSFPGFLMNSSGNKIHKEDGQRDYRLSKGAK